MYVQDKEGLQCLKNNMVIRRQSDLGAKTGGAILVKKRLQKLDSQTTEIFPRQNDEIQKGKDKFDEETD